MIHIDILTVMPELLDSPFSYSIVQRAKAKGIVELSVINLRNYATGKHRRVDDYAFSGEAGMVMMIEPVFRAITDLKGKREYDEIIYTSPDGVPFSQKEANRLSTLGNMIILCGHYKGIDHRIREYLITKEISIGDYVLTGGELAAAVICDTVIRLLPGAMSDESSALSDSFQDNLLAPPGYTRPAEFNGWKVPEILLQGNAAAIDQWKFEQSIERTQRLRPNLLQV
jgi:tRNA (guanine37-N1)-methyltransferase